MDLSREAGIIEAILFLESEPVDLGQITRISGLDKDVVRQVLADLVEHYSRDSHGITLGEIGGGWLLSPKEDLWDGLKDYYGRRSDDRLSRAAMETLSIIAYSQPLTRAEIENIRGVSADGMIRLLLRRNLIKDVGRKDAPGRPVLYGTTRDFLKAFRLKSIADLPKLEELDRDRFELNG